MATYYVGKDGSDANNGLGPDASAVTNKPWLTIGKALGAAGIASGDTVYVGPGTYREVVDVAMTSAVAETSVLGDPGNAQGFKTAAGVLVSPAEVIWTAYLTNDTTAPSATATLTMSARDYLTFQYITFVGGTGAVIAATTQTSTNITFRDCCFVNTSNSIILVSSAFSTALNWMIERCAFQLTAVSGVFFSFTPATGVGSDYSVNVTIRNSLFVGGTGSQAVVFTPSGASAQKPGGISVYNCTIVGGMNVGFETKVNSSTTYPMNIYNCQVYVRGQGFLAETLGQLVENYNYVRSSTSHTNVTQGANTLTGTDHAMVWHLGEESLYGFTPRMFMEPKVGSWMLTFGNDGTYTTAEDFLGLPRPGGGASATKGIGYLGRGNTFTKETGTVRTGSNAISITGPGTQDFQLPVNASSTTATVYVRWDATYAGTKPLMKVLNGGECGVTDATATATGSSGSWEQLSLNFTPARVGIVTIRFQSSDTNGAGVMYVDDFAVT